MQLLNNTGMLASYTMGMDASGREYAVVVVKGTFNIPRSRQEKPVLLEEQVPFVEADTFSGEPGFSSPLFEVDYAPVKHHCDVTLVGSAYAPGGKPASRVQAGFKIGNMSKVLDVLGDRVWVADPTGVVSSPPVAFEKRAITYDIAFGGVDRFHEDESKHDPYMLNPIGIGYHKQLASELLDNTPAPSTEESGKPVKRPDGDYRPMSLGPIGRGWAPRYLLGGTYDEQWLEDNFPFLPPDFDELYYQSAPSDQQMPYLKGGELVMLLNVTEDGKRMFELPEKKIPVVFFKKKSERVETEAVLDTLVLEPDQQRFTLTWRASTPLKNSMFDIPEALVGTASKAWWRARELGKTYYPGLQALVSSNRDEDPGDES